MMTRARSLAAQALDILSPHPSRAPNLDQAPMDEIIIPIAPHDSPSVASFYGQLSVGEVGNNQQEDPTVTLQEDPTLTLLNELLAARQRDAILIQNLHLRSNDLDRTNQLQRQANRDLLHQVQHLSTMVTPAVLPLITGSSHTLQEPILHTRVLSDTLPRVLSDTLPPLAENVPAVAPHPHTSRAMLPDPSISGPGTFNGHQPNQTNPSTTELLLTAIPGMLDSLYTTIADHHSTTTHRAKVITKYDPFDPSKQFKGWSQKIINTVSHCRELKVLFNQDTGKLHTTTPIGCDEHDNTFYQRLADTLPTDNTFLFRTDLMGHGIKLHQSLESAYLPQDAQHRNAQLQRFLNPSFRRPPRQSVDLWYNTFNELARDISSGVGGIVIPQIEIRQRFIRSLGGRFDRLAEELDLDMLPSLYITGTWDQLLSKLRQVSVANEVPTPNLPTPNLPTPNLVPTIPKRNGGYTEGGGREGGGRTGPTNTGNPEGGQGRRERTVEEAAHQAKVTKLFQDLPQSQKAIFLADHTNGTSNFRLQGALATIQSQVGNDFCIFHVLPHTTGKCTFLHRLCTPISSGTGTGAHGLTASARQALLCTIVGPTVDPSVDASIVDHNVTNTNTHGYSTSIQVTPKMVADSGTTRHMFNDMQFFPHGLEDPPLSSHVQLADESTIPILGIGTASCTAIDGLNHHPLILPDVLYVPALSENLYSVHHHWNQPGHDIVKTETASGELDTLSLKFPTFSVPLINTDEAIYAPIYPHQIPIITPIIEQTSTTTRQVTFSDPLVTLAVPYTPLNDEAIIAQLEMLKQRLAHLDGDDPFINITTPMLNSPVHESVEAALLDADLLEAELLAPPSRDTHTDDENTRTRRNFLKKCRKISSASRNNTPLPVATDTAHSLSANTAEMTNILRTRPPVSEISTYGSLGLPVQNPLYSDTASGRALVDLLVSIPENLDIVSRITVRDTTNDPDNPLNVTLEEILAVESSVRPQGTIEPTLAVESADHLHSTTAPPVTLELTPRTAPILRSVDRPSPNLAPNKTVSIDELRASTGFLASSTLKPLVDHMSLFQPNFNISTDPPDPTFSLGSVAKINKSSRHTSPIPRPEQFGDVIHCDIVFGSKAAFGGITHALFLVDRHSRCKFMYPLTNLTTDVVKAFQRFLTQVGPVRRIITDKDDKLLAGPAQLFLESNKVIVQGAPTEHQSQNGLAERNWQTVQGMARAWLANAQLPVPYWWWAVNRATEVLNYIPIKDENNNTYSTPFELAFHSKPDLRTLFPLFSLAYIRKMRDGSIKRSKYVTHSEACIVVGRSHNTNGLLFYNPTSRETYTSVDYVLDPTIAAGPYFNYKYSPSCYFGSKSDNDTQPIPLHPPGSTVYHITSPTSDPATVIDIPSQDGVYTIEHEDGRAAFVPATDLLPAPVPQPQLLDWVRHNAKITLFLPTMVAPKQGLLLHHVEDNSWTFSPGRNQKHAEIHLDIPAQLNYFLAHGQLFQGHVKFPLVYAAQAAIARHSKFTTANYNGTDTDGSTTTTHVGVPVNIKNLRNSLSGEALVDVQTGIVIEDTDLKQAMAQARHVSARLLTSDQPPSSLKQVSTMCASDRSTWLAAYNEEYDGLLAAGTYEVISYEEYNILKSEHGVGPILPSMALANIKFDECGQPVRAKYRIVVCGNRDTTVWDHPDITAPVLDGPEFRTLVALAIHHRRRLKQADVKQAFLHSILPSSDTYVVRPPTNCPRSRHGTLWNLKKSLYGLRRSPKLWYDTIKTVLASLGLHSSKTSPCLFTGIIIPGSAPLHLGLYVDDFVYFSPDAQVEQRFEDLFSQHFPVEFMGIATHFLGLHIQWRDEEDGNLFVHLSQSAYIDEVLDKHGLSNANPVQTPYRSGTHVDTVDGETSDTITTKYLSIVGSLGWLANMTRPDLSTIHNLLAQYSSKPTSGHLQAATYVLQYLIGTKTHGISFTSLPTQFYGTYNYFPLTHADANWGPQDASQPNPKPNAPIIELPLFATRSISGFVTFLAGGPIQWKSKRQDVTAMSTAEAEIYATNEATKYLLTLSNTIHDLQHRDIFFPPGQATTIYNDNKSCVDWCKGTTTKRLRHMQIWENLIRENIEWDFLTVKHIPGNQNLADIFTKEMKDIQHFIDIRDQLVTACPQVFPIIES